MRRPQLTLRSLLVAMMVVAAFFGGVAIERRRKAAHYEDLVESLKAENAALRNPFVIGRRNGAPRGSSATTRSWLQGHAEAVETRGFEGLTPIRD